MSALRTAAGLRQISAIHFRDADNVLRSVETGHVRNAAGALKTFFSAMSATASPDNVRGYASIGGIATVATPNVTATPSGGVAPYIYLWGQTDGGAWTIAGPTSATTAFWIELDAGEGADATFHCTITDAAGATAVTNDVAASAVNIGGGGLIVGGGP